MQLLFSVIYKWLKSVDSTKTSFQLTNGSISQLYCQKTFFFFFYYSRMLSFVMEKKT